MSLKVGIFQMEVGPGALPKALITMLVHLEQGSQD
jgi:hypothetical protein